jgi:hypothetical protein
MKTRPSNPRRTLRAVTLVACLGGFLLALAAVALPALHDGLHRDASHPQHECVVTMLIAGKVQLGGDLPPSAPPRPGGCLEHVPTLRPVWVATAFAESRIFEHAPPALS